MKTVSTETVDTGLTFRHCRILLETSGDDKADAVALKRFRRAVAKYFPDPDRLPEASDGEMMAGSQQ